MDAIERIRGYAAERGVTWEQMQAAGCSLGTAYSSHTEAEHDALVIPTSNGNRYRFLDKEEAKQKYTSDSGYTPCWFGLKRAVSIAQKTDSPLILCNGEVSTIAAQVHGLPAACITSGEKVQMPMHLFRELVLLYGGSDIVIAADCDESGTKAAYGIAAQLSALYSVRVVALPFADDSHCDIADWCRQCHETTTEPTALYGLPTRSAPIAAAKIERTPKVRAVQADSAQIKEDIRERFDMLLYARGAWSGKRIDEKPDRNGEYEVHSMGGMYINPDKGTWSIPANGSGYGGDCFSLVAFALYGDPTRTGGADFPAVVEEAARFAGVQLPEKHQTRSQPRSQPDQCPVDQTLDTDTSTPHVDAERALAYEAIALHANIVTEENDASECVDALPDEVADLVRAIAANTEMNVSIPLVAALGALAMATEATVWINDSHHDQVLLYLAAAAGSGEGKSVAWKYFFKPIMEMQWAQKDVHDQWAALPDEDKHTIAEPIAKMLYVTNITSEKLGVVLQENGGRSAILTDEGRSMTDILVGRYSKNGDDGGLDLYTKAWEGGEYTAFRVNRDAVQIREAKLNICVGIQPGAFEKFMGSGAVTDSGLLARFLVVRPPSKVGSRTFDGPAIPQNVIDRYNEYMRRLLRTKKPRTLAINGAGQAIIRDFRLEMEPRIAETGDLSHMASWVNRIPQHVARIAAVLYCSVSNMEHNGTETIPVVDVQVAIDLVRFFANEFKRAAYDPTASNKDMKLAIRMNTWLHDKVQKNDTFTLQTVRRGLAITKEAAAEAIDILISAGCVSEIEHDGRRDRRIFRYIQPLDVS